MSTLGRRTFLTSTAVAAVSAGFDLRSPRAIAAPAQVHDRPTLTSGVQSGEVTTTRAVLWSRADGPGRLVARVTSGRQSRVLRGGEASAATDHTAKLFLAGLTPGREYDAALWFEDENGRAGEVQHARFRTASERPEPTSFVWTGDTCGQGWGINPDLGGLVG